MNVADLFGLTRTGRRALGLASKELGPKVWELGEVEIRVAAPRRRKERIANVWGTRPVMKGM